jgi:hypothetical protein
MVDCGVRYRGTSVEIRKAESGQSSPLVNIILVNASTSQVSCSCVLKMISKWSPTRVRNSVLQVI